MGTPAEIVVRDSRNTFAIYTHWDGAPHGEHGILNRLRGAFALAWPLPRFEANDFSAAIVASLKKRPGGTYLAVPGQMDANYVYNVRHVGTEMGVRVVVRDLLDETSEWMVTAEAVTQIGGAP